MDKKFFNIRRAISHFHSLIYVFFLAWSSAGLLVGCVRQTSSHTVLHDDAQGRVWLEQAPDSSATGLQATHPVVLDSAILASALRGIRIRSAAGLGGWLQGSEATALQERETAFLAPLLSAALKRATAAQFVGFELRRTAPALGPARATGAAVGSDGTSNWSQPEVTSGALYVFGRSLHITLTKWRAVPERPDDIQMANRRRVDPTGLAGATVAFEPAAAQRPDTYRREALPFSADLPSLVLDYGALAHPLPVPLPRATPAESAPPATAPPIVTPQPASETQALKELVIKQELELERLRKELQQRTPPTGSDHTPLPGTKKAPTGSTP